MSRWIALLFVPAVTVGLVSCDDQSAQQKKVDYHALIDPVGEASATEQTVQAPPVIQPESINLTPAEARRLRLADPTRELEFANVAAHLEPSPLDNPSTPAARLPAMPFEPLKKSVVLGGLEEGQPFLLPPNHAQKLIAARLREPNLLPNPAMTTVNETTRDEYELGRFVFRTHSLNGNAAITRSDLFTGKTAVIAQRSDLDALGPIRWTAWGTILAAETVQGAADPHAPNAMGGLVYEIDPFPELRETPVSDNLTVRPALGAMAHRGMAFDRDGRLYLVGGDETAGAVFMFVPDSPDSLQSGQLFALKLDDPDQGGAAQWVPIDGDAAAVNARDAAETAGATFFVGAGDAEVGASRDGQKKVLYVAIAGDVQGNGRRVISVDLAGDEPVVRNFITPDTIDAATRQAVGNSLQAPAELALDSQGNLYVAERSTPLTIGDDVWLAIDSNDDGQADAIGRFASLATFGAEPAGIYVHPFDTLDLYVNVTHPTSLNDSVFVIRPTTSVPPVAMRPVGSDGGTGGLFGEFIAGFVGSGGNNTPAFGALAMLSDDDDDDDDDDGNKEVGSPDGDDDDSSQGDDDDTTPGDDDDDTPGDDDDDTPALGDDDDDDDFTGDDDDDVALGDDDDDDDDLTGDDDDDNGGGIVIEDDDHDDGDKPTDPPLYAANPEPVTLSLGALSLGGMLLTLGRRRR